MLDDNRKRNFALATAVTYLLLAISSVDCSTWSLAPYPGFGRERRMLEEVQVSISFQYQFVSIGLKS